MPRTRTSFQVVADSFTIAGGGTATVYVDLKDSTYPQVMLKQTYSATASTTGVSVVLYPGFVVSVASGFPVGTETIEYADNGNSVTEIVAPTANQVTTQTTRSAWSINSETYPRYLKMEITNNDASNSVTIRIVGDW